MAASTKAALSKASIPAAGSGRNSGRSARSAASFIPPPRVEPGVIKHVYGDKFSLGEPDGSSSDRIVKLSAALTAGGLRAPVLDKIRDEIWLKLWGNLCFNPISALTHATLDVITSDPETRAVARAMMLEAKEIGDRLGVHFRVDVERRINGARGCGRA